MLSAIPSALKRKFGPLPAWAWAIIFAGGLIYYRRLKGQQGGLATPSDLGTGVGGAPAEPQAPVVLQPGESVYDPSTQKLLGGNPAGDEPTPEAPPDTTTSPTKTTKKKPKPKGKRAKKNKVHKQRPVEHPRHVGKPARARVRPTVKPAVRRSRKPKTVAHPTGARAGSAHKTPAAVGRTRTMPPAPALRQRPAARLVTSPEAQRVLPNPAHVTPRAAATRKPQAAARLRRP